MNDYFSRRVRKLVGILIAVSVVGLICTPLLPWVTVDYQDSQTQAQDTAYLMSGELRDTAINWDGGSNLNWITWSFWLTIVFGIVALLGVAIHQIQRYRLFAHILLVSGSIVILFGVLNIVNHIWLIGEISDLSHLYQTQVNASFFFNYIPFIMGVAVLIASIGYLVVVLPASIQVFAGYAGRAGRQRRSPPRRAQSTATTTSGEQEQSPENRITVTCPACGNSWSMQKPDEPTTVFCPSCGKSGRIE